jgi:hypothetical protein
LSSWLESKVEAERNGIDRGRFHGARRFGIGRVVTVATPTKRVRLNTIREIRREMSYQYKQARSGALDTVDAWRLVKILECRPPWSKAPTSRNAWRSSRRRAWRASRASPTVTVTTRTEATVVPVNISREAIRRLAALEAREPGGPEDYPLNLDRWYWRELTYIDVIFQRYSNQEYSEPPPGWIAAFEIFNEIAALAAKRAARPAPSRVRSRWCP